ncbi:ribose-5-phosphate isomerase RpiA [Lacticaseibacillus saniviri]|uniref:Ribose-5-phosphate isomerase A n=1 Tax=Lacticaseibacillus saniviri JCM 17471 = DSM 24301 TaxID=1293598 RepID=A0A0R2MRG2_9LACO|nr:ribose-5-phosphate isomerase RpiA [Lacticaseibacillus saniviri]KRO16200.1 ribose 5-phosphate isomerase A [Lacticaseibacillus saniviri JCM 17471 = DSM 24301]MCG4281654.1 ribose-5-phosphate isomerase RpiA [Lacticaseibacillus saniviri]
MNEQELLKQQVAASAAQLVVPGSILGVGTGSTVKWFISELAKRDRLTPLNLAAIVTTSNRSKEQLESYGFKVVELADIDHADLVVDGADRVDDQLNGIKGGGGALTLEKSVAVNSEKNVWIVDEGKLVHHLGGFPLPVEVLPISCEQNFRQFEQAGLEPTFRQRQDGKRYITHYGNYIIDLGISPLPIPSGLAGYLDSTVGVVEHGLFLDICDELLIARHDGTVETRYRNQLNKIPS